jgi:NAD(P)H dehydrogenase (quinone)
MTIAVTGANGQFGRIVVAGLIEKLGAKDVVGLVRTPEKAADLGIAIRKADYDAPETLAPALAGIDTLLLISGSDIGKRAAQHKAVIDAAK